ncbi:MAG: hypothetical protein JEZ03_07345 [Bacteroidales bacterium]|nr:hypothetical protein [Bacteroidales bacterium]
MRLKKKSGFVLVMLMTFVMASCVSSKDRSFRKARKKYRKIKNYDCGCSNTIQNTITFEVVNGRKTI